MPINRPTLHKIEAIKTENEEVKTFKFRSSELAKKNEPGQFVMLWDPGIDEIPISIANASPKGEVEVAVADVGDCTHSLHQKHRGDLIGLRGDHPYMVKVSHYCRVKEFAWSQAVMERRR